MRPNNWVGYKQYLVVVAERPEWRFWRKVERRGENECWFVRSRRDPRFHLMFSFRGEQYYYHRYSWALHNKEEPGDLLVTHRCHNPHCVNPKHLRLGTEYDNRLDQLVAHGGKKKRTALPSKWEPPT